MDTSAYEAACRRYKDARENFPRAKRIMDAAQDEYDAAYAALAEFEEKPGIPLPQYRTYSGALAAQKADALAVPGMEG